MKQVSAVGKGVTFDSGGISIKPAGGMEDHEVGHGAARGGRGHDESAGAAKAKPKFIGVCGLRRKLCRPTAQRPGDVVHDDVWQDLEVINTDAEGRLVLCGCADMGQRKISPRRLSEDATRPARSSISSGHEYAGMF